MKILFSGFTIDSEECIYGDYIFLRNCGPNGYLSKYHSPANLDNNEDLHLGKIKIIDTDKMNIMRKQKRISNNGEDMKIVFFD